jgi:MtrB/PioB family decaheme-associated outer membrane protein
MKKYHGTLSFAVAGLLLLPAAAGFAAEEADVSGSLMLGVRGVDEQEESARFQKYRDYDDGVYGDLRLNYFKDSYHFKVKGRNIGQGDQFYKLKGGEYGKYDYKFLYDQIPHNLSFDARTFYIGPGSNNLVIGLDPFDENSRTIFDFSVDRKRYGGEIEMTLDSPFFVNVGAYRREKEGLQPLGSGSFSGSVELPAPVDYATNDFNLAAGYRSSEIMVKVSGMISNFENDNDFLRWQNPFTGANELNPLTPDNDYGKIAGGLTWRKLPYMTTFILNGSYANLSNDYTNADIDITLPGVVQADFDGDVSYANLSANLVSRPTENLGSRIFYAYLDRENDSSVTGILPGGIRERLDDDHNHFLSYTRNNFGVDLSYDCPSQTTAWAGYEFVDVDRENRPDVESNTDNIFYVKLKNAALDYLTGKVQYTYLNRDGDSEFDLAGVTPSDAEYILQFIQRFDRASKTRHEFKVTVDLYPADDVDLGLEYTFADNDYDDVVLGRTEDQGHEFYVDLMWRVSQMLHLSGFAGYEMYEADSNHYVHRAGFEGQTADPTVEDGNPDSFRWTQDREEDFWTYGLAARVPLMQDRLKLSLSWEYQQSDGESDFTTEGPAPLENIDDFEDYYISILEARALYALTGQIDLALGYIYEKSDYDDLQYLGYDYTPSGTLLSGAYADHDYEAHIGYFTVKYTF